jgi:chromosome segregation ATPase
MDAHEPFEDSLASVKADEVSSNPNEAAVAEAPSDPQIPPPMPSTADLEQKIAELQAAFDAEIRSRKSAESDRDFFREQYSRASAYVSTVRSENEELVERVEIAEKRAVEGVALVKATFQERVRVLEADVAQTRAGYRLLLERERRTGDEIRRRAGEEPELRARCKWLEQRVEDLEMDLEELEAEKENWLSEVEVGKQLSVEEEANMDQDAEGEEDVEAQMEERPGVGLTETPEDGYEMVHRCQWRADGLELCDRYFPDIEVRKFFFSAPRTRLKILLLGASDTHVHCRTHTGVMM